MDMVAFLPKVTAETWGRPGGKHPERQSCKESHRCGGQASDQAKTSEFQVGHQAWPADMSAPRAPTAGPGGGWVMSAMLETSPILTGGGGASLPCHRPFRKPLRYSGERGYVGEAPAMKAVP